jgi:hypothetical protein
MSCKEEEQMKIWNYRPREPWWHRWGEDGMERSIVRGCGSLLVGGAVTTLAILAALKLLGVPIF